MWPTPPRLLPTQASSSLPADVCEFSLYSPLFEEPEDNLPLMESVVDVEGNEPEIDKDKVRMEERDANLQYFRADELWDYDIHAYRLTETMATTSEDDHGEYVFHVRRRFDCEGQYLETLVDIKSKVLKNILWIVLGSCKAVSLEEDTPAIGPNILFLYYEDLKKYYKDMTAKNNSKKKDHNTVVKKAKHLKCLIQYIEKDYKSVEKSMCQLIEAGNITFDLLWTLFRSDEIIYTSTYSAPDEPRAFKVDYVSKKSSPMKGTWYVVQGRYIDFDGKAFGFGSMEVEIQSYKGTSRITSLPCFPIKYHKEYETLQKQLIERGNKFIALAGTKHRSYVGLGLTKIEDEVSKVSVNSRVIIDPRSFRHTNPNYPISTVQPADPDPFAAPRQNGDEEGCCSGNNKELLEMEVEDDGSTAVKESTKQRHGQDGQIERKFSKEDLLISSPLVLGFAFSEKLWLEFTVSGIKDIQWNESAFDSLVLPDDQKSIVKALVQSHTSGAQEHKLVDDFVEGKGQGLLTVLHGPPGVGKTLTAEGIAELLKRPLYHISVGELGTNPRQLEQELGKILNIAHTWGAVLLLDEADVFLEARMAQDIHRNALVSIFLNMLEYFQGILFLTTNRVKTFDDAFQSRIHMAIKVSQIRLEQPFQAVS